MAGGSAKSVDEATVVTVSTAVELVARMYVGAHAAKGDFEQLSAAHSFGVPSGGEDYELLQRYFGADYAVGMSLLGLAGTRGWSRASELVAGVRAMPHDQLVGALLSATTLEPADQAATRAEVQLALDDDSQHGPVLRKLARRNSYASKDVEYLLADRHRASTELVHLLETCLAAFERDESAIASQLADRVSEITQLVSSAGRQEALLRLTGGWTLMDDTQPLLLVPTKALGSFVITRLLDDGRMVVAFGPLQERRKHSIDDLATLAHALGNKQRLEILRQIGREPASGQTLARSLGLTEATVHYHTSRLRTLGLVTSTRNVHSVVHSVDSKQLTQALTDIARAVLGDQASTIDLDGG